MVPLVSLAQPRTIHQPSRPEQTCWITEDQACPQRQRLLDSAKHRQNSLMNITKKKKKKKKKKKSHKLMCPLTFKGKVLLILQE
jgi:hypothetical protein